MPELEHLARRVRLLQALLVASTVLCLALGTVALALALRQPDAVQARAFQVVDSSGQVWAELSVEPTGPQLELYDENGTRRAALLVPAMGPGEEALDQAYLDAKRETVRRSHPWLNFWDHDAELVGSVGRSP